MFYKFFNSYQGRNVLPGERVQVYRNLKFKDSIVYSIRDAQTNLVLGHATHILLSKCKFVVSEAGRRRVLREKKKNVHAWIEGSFGVLHAGDDQIFNKGYRVYYDPYVNSNFVIHTQGFRNTEVAIFDANIVYIGDEGAIASGF